MRCVRRYYGTLHKQMSPKQYALLRTASPMNPQYARFEFLRVERPNVEATNFLLVNEQGLEKTKKELEPKVLDMLVEISNLLDDPDKNLVNILRLVVVDKNLSIKILIAGTQKVRYSGQSFGTQDIASLIR